MSPLPPGRRDGREPSARSDELLERADLGEEVGEALGLDQLPIGLASRRLHGRAEIGEASRCGRVALGDRLSTGQQDGRG